MVVLVVVLVMVLLLVEVVCVSIRDEGLWFPFADLCLQYKMQLHVCCDSHTWGSGGGGAEAIYAASSSAASSAATSAAVRPRGDDATAAASTHIQHTAAAAAAVHQQLVLYALVMSFQTVDALRNDRKYVAFPRAFSAAAFCCVDAADV